LIPEEAPVERGGEGTVLDAGEDHAMNTRFGEQCGRAPNYFLLHQRVSAHPDM
jgi:hypothetical protein